VVRIDAEPGVRTATWSQHRAVRPTLIHYDRLVLVMSEFVVVAHAVGDLLHVVAGALALITVLSQRRGH
jgi:hypothetical protein